jgi:predicted Zn-dependent peptidase
MKTWRLKNDIEVLFKKTNGANVVCVRIFTPLSTIGENKNNAGIANLTSCVMTKASIERSLKKLADDIDNIGAALSAGTYYDFACIEMSFLSEYFDKAIEILADVIINPAFDAKDIDNEKSNILASIAAQRDSITKTARNHFLKLFYAGTPYSNSVYGNKETILNADKMQMSKWHKDAYNAQNIIISSAGNIDENALKETFEKYFGEIKKEKKFEKPVFDIKRADKEISVFNSKFNQGFIFAGFDADSLFGKRFETLKVVAEMLGGKMTSRLFVELREKLGLAYEVGASYPSKIEKSYFGIYIGLDKKNIDMTLKRIDEILKDFCSKKVSDKEIDDVKNYMKGAYVMNKQTVSDLSYNYGVGQTLGLGYDYNDKYMDRVMKINADDIFEAANETFGNKPIIAILK